VEKTTIERGTDGKLRRIQNTVETKNVDAGSASPGDSQKTIEKALHDAFGQDAASGSARFSPVETHPTHVIARGPEGKLHRINYTNKDSGVEFGDSQEVQKGDDLRSPMQK
jgi:hypothetical protein